MERVLAPPSISSFSGVGGDSFRLSGGARQFGSPPLPVRQENGKVYVGGDPNCLAPPLKRKLSPPTPENEEIDGGAKTRSNGHANGAANGLAINERLTRSTRTRSGGTR